MSQVDVRSVYPNWEQFLQKVSEFCLFISGDSKLPQLSLEEVFRYTVHHFPPMLDPLNFSEQQIWILINRSALEKVISNHAYEMFQRGNFIVRAVSLISAPGKVSSPHAIPHGTIAMPKRIFIHYLLSSRRNDNVFRALLGWARSYQHFPLGGTVY